MTPPREGARNENATLAVALAVLGIVPLLGLLSAVAAVAAATIALQALLILPFLYRILRGAATGSLLGM